MKFIYNKLLVFVLLLLFTNVIAQTNIQSGGVNIPMVSGDADQEPEEAQTPIDMYEGALMIVATSMIAGYYFVRNRRQIN